MQLTAADLARVEAAEASHQRMLRLQRMNHYQLRALLSGDPVEAAVWITSAAEYGLPAAQLRLGRMLLEGVGVARDAALALFWFKRAADQLDAEAMNMMGRCHENGWGTASDPGTAARWYQQSAQRGHDWGQYNFGNSLFDGRGVGQDAARALTWYLLSARQGHARAMNLAGRCCEEGWGCARDLAAAFEWYRRSAQAGYFRAQFNYAALLSDRGLNAPAAEWYWMAAETGTPAIREAIVERLSQTRDPLLQALRGRVIAHFAAHVTDWDATASRP
jgi:TPR repeat protein